MVEVKNLSVFDKPRRVAGLIAVLAVVAAGALGLAPAASAHEGDVPWHKSPVTECSYNGTSRIVKAFTPGRSSVGGYSTEWETIYWRANLWRYYSAPYNDWYKVDWSPWLRASGNYIGLAPNSNGSWNDYLNATGLYNFWSFSSLTAGSYAVEVTLYWSSTGAQHSEWAPMNGYYYCTF